MFPFTLHQLRILRAIATEQNFTKAAEILYLSQPSLSKQLKSLEASLEILLINRSKSQPFLTKDGRLVLRYTERILFLCEETCRMVNAIKKKEYKSLTIGTTPLIAIYLLPKLFELLDQKYPTITFSFQVLSSIAASNQINIKTIDIIILNEKNLFLTGKLSYKVIENSFKMEPIYFILKK